MKLKANTDVFFPLSWPLKQDLCKGFLLQSAGDGFVDGYVILNQDGHHG